MLSPLGVLGLGSRGLYPLPPLFPHPHPLLTFIPLLIKYFSSLHYVCTVLNIENTASLKRDAILCLVHLSTDEKDAPMCAGIAVPGTERQEIRKQRNDNTEEHRLNATIPAECLWPDLE